MFEMCGHCQCVWIRHEDKLQNKSLHRFGCYRGFPLFLVFLCVTLTLLYIPTLLIRRFERLCHGYASMAAAVRSVMGVFASLLSSFSPCPHKQVQFFPKKSKVPSSHELTTGGYIRFGTLAINASSHRVLNLSFLYKTSPLPLVVYSLSSAPLPSSHPTQTFPFLSPFLFNFPHLLPLLLPQP